MKPKGGQRERETLETREGARKGEIRKKEGERVRGERGKCASEQKRERETTVKECV